MSEIEMFALGLACGLIIGLGIACVAIKNYVSRPKNARWMAERLRSKGYG